ncbi:hypothetical protein [uncultured Aquimarina sp.]|uniref:hypothetical protein n=1 Tax=uncultured Aquimarina sp. TaxID=575652 RepID=UPI00262C7427|nr:hypothetical protein [uncultured Aquimarina sp.]
MTELSKHNIFIKLFLPVVFGVMGMIMSIVFLKHQSIWLVTAISIITLVVYLITIKAVRDSKKLMYDKKFLYINSKRGNSKISLENIRKFTIKRTNIRLLGFNIIACNIEFLIEDKRIKSTIFWAFESSFEINDFENLINNNKSY